jgi:hypothetical protein
MDLNGDGKTNSFGWNSLVNTLIESSTYTEDVHSTISGFLDPKIYYRLNPELKEKIAIDDKDVGTIKYLREMAYDYIKDLDAHSADLNSIYKLVKLLEQLKM